MTPSLKNRVSKPISRLALSGTLGLEEVRAAMAIEAAVVSILTQDIHSGGVVERKTGAVNSGSGFEESFLKRHDIRQSYYIWIDIMKIHDLPAGPVLDVIIDGRPLTEVDRAWKRRKGWARGILFSSLRLFIENERQGREQINRLTA